MLPVSIPKSPGNAQGTRTQPAPRKAILLESIENEYRTEIQRKRREYDAQIRDAQLTAELKQLYDFTCMFCGERLQVGISPDRYYAEGAHIRAVGEPDKGPDIASNMLVLCPNHHRQFDNGILLLRRISKDKLKVVARVPDHPLHDAIVKLHESHSIDDQFIDWHTKKWRARDR